MKTGIDALHIRRRSRQRDEMRNEARHGMQQEQRAIRVRTTDMHVLAEHGELLREIAVELGKVLKARGIEDLTVAPLLEGVRATATQPDIQMVSGGHERVANLVEVTYSLFMRRTDARG